jgi:hypothetical protein
LKIAIGRHIAKKRLKGSLLVTGLAREIIVASMMDKMLWAFLAAQNLSLWQYRMCSCNTLFLAKSSNLVYV